jgi:hypothetical protein
MVGRRCLQGYFSATVTAYGIEGCVVVPPIRFMEDERR